MALLALSTWFSCQVPLILCLLRIDVPDSATISSRDDANGHLTTSWMWENIERNGYYDQRIAPLNFRDNTSTINSNRST